jgi:4-amino-4-deoxy-L-arabinose transferase-like glycosyltransferase
MRLVLADPRGLEGPFILLQRLSAALFGHTPFALLLPSAVIGSLTVLLIYLVTRVILAEAPPAEARTIGLLAALLAATSQWHVSLSRAGVQIVALPFLMCLALYLVLLALRLDVSLDAPPGAPSRRRAHRHRRSTNATALNVKPVDHLRRRRILLFIGSGVAAGLASDIAPGMWILPVLILLIVALARWQRPQWYHQIATGLVSLAGTIILVALPGVWQFYLNHNRVTPTATHSAPTTLNASQPLLLSALHVLRQIGLNERDVFQVLTAQDYSAAWPATGGTPIVPSALGIVFYVGLALLVWHWRRLSSLTILLLVIFPFLATLAVGSGSNVILAASVLPAICIVPAVMLYQVARWLGSVPIVFDRANGARVFANPDRIGRVLLMVFLLFSALRTFFWYFQATLPTTPPNAITPN